jgi:type IV secretion system protein VirB2
MEISIRFACCHMPFPPHAAYAQSGSPFDSGLTSLQNLFTGAVAKVASLIAIVIGGYGFAHEEPGPFPCCG